MIRRLENRKAVYDCVVAEEREPVTGSHALLMGKVALCCQNSEVKWNLMCLKSCCAMLST